MCPKAICTGQTIDALRLHVKDKHNITVNTVIGVFRLYSLRCEFVGVVVEVVENEFGYVNNSSIS